MNAPPDWRFLIRVLVAGAFTLLMALGAAMFLFYALGLSCFVAALLGRDHPYGFSIGAALLFATTLLVPTLMDGLTGVDPLSTVVLVLGQCLAIGFGAASVVQLLRWIVTKVKP
jgi:hypothetical protein